MRYPCRCRRAAPRYLPALLCAMACAGLFLAAAPAALAADGPEAPASAEPSPAPSPEDLPPYWDVTELDMTDLTHDGVEQAIQSLAHYPRLRLVTLPPQTDDPSGVTLKDVGKFQAAYPSVLFDYRFTIWGRDVSTLDRTLDLSHVTMDDNGAAVREALPYMTRCTTLDMDSCGVSNEDMAAIRDDFPNIKVIWRVWFGWRYTCRTDTKRILASLSDYTVTGENASVLQYCTEVRYLDLGHSPSLDDISFVRYMPDLEVAILAISIWTDCSPLASCPKLEYLEMFNTRCTDLAPLTALKNLRHLNVAYLKDLTDVSPLFQMTWLERLWVGRDNQVPVEDLEALQAALPDCEVNITNTYDPTGDGWRWNSERYQLLREQFDYDSEYAYSLY